MRPLHIAAISLSSLVIGLIALFGGAFLTTAFTGPTQLPPGGSGLITTNVAGTNLGVGVSNPTFKLQLGGGDFGLGSGSQIDFTDETGDKVYWYGTNYGTGIEPFTLTNWSLQNHKWRIGSNGGVSGDPVYMTLTATGLAVHTQNTPLYALDVTGDVNFTGTLRRNGSPLTFGDDKWIISGGNMYTTSSITNVGIGTASPGTKLEVEGVARFDGATADEGGEVRLAAGTSGGSDWFIDVVNYGNPQLRIRPGATSTVVFEGTGDVGIGVTPTYKLDVGGVVRVGSISGSGDPTGANGAIYYNSTNNKFRCYENGAWKDCISAVYQ